VADWNVNKEQKRWGFSLEKRWLAFIEVRVSHLFSQAKRRKRHVVGKEVAGIHRG
jgi:hypothetical protein